MLMWRPCPGTRLQTANARVTPRSAARRAFPEHFGNRSRERAPRQSAKVYRSGRYIHFGWDRLLQLLWLSSFPAGDHLRKVACLRPSKACQVFLRIMTMAPCRQIDDPATRRQLDKPLIREIDDTRDFFLLQQRRSSYRQLSVYFSSWRLRAASCSSTSWATSIWASCRSTSLLVWAVGTSRMPSSTRRSMAEARACM